MLQQINERTRERKTKREQREEDEAAMDRFIYERPRFEPSQIEDPSILNPKYSLHNYQREIIAWMRSREILYDTDRRRSIRNGYHGIRGGMLMAEMGLGKTLITLTHSILSPGEGPSLIVCSKTVMNVWKAEAEKFYGNHIKILMLHPDFTKASKIDKLKPADLLNYDLVITTYGTVRSCDIKKEYDTGLENPVKHGRYSFHLSELGDSDTLQKGKVQSVREQGILDQNVYMYYTLGIESILFLYWERIFLDESSEFITNWKTHTYKSHLCLSSKYKWCLTGTPIRNKESDIWTQLRFCGYLGVKYAEEWNYGIYLREQLYEALYIIYKKDVEDELGIPLGRTDMAVYCEMNEEEQRIYNACLGQLGDAYQRFLTGIEEFAHVLTKFLRLRQCCVAPYLLNSAEEWSPTSYVHNRELGGLQASKIQKILEIINENPDDKFLVFSSFIEPAFLIADQLPENTYAIINGNTPIIERGIITDLFINREDFKVLFLSYKTGSKGLNLTAANHVILVEPWWTPVVHEQAICRADRNGQTREVKVDYILIEGTIEDKIREICLEKKEIMQAFFGRKRELPNTSTGISADLIGKILGLK